MPRNSFSLFALATAASLAGGGHANAGACCDDCAAPCPTPIYVVNQGPVVSGPGIFVPPPITAACCGPATGYPYVGYGYPYIGPPYADPVPQGIYNPYYRHRPRVHYGPRHPRVVRGGGGRHVAPYRPMPDRAPAFPVADPRYK
jgi:hypothetical protein